MRVDEAIEYMVQEEEQKLIDMDQVARMAIARVECVVVRASIEAIGSAPADQRVAAEQRDIHRQARGHRPGAAIDIEIRKPQRIEVIRGLLQRANEAGRSGDGGQIKQVSAAFSENRRRILVANSDGLLADDNRQLLSDLGLDKIRIQLRGIYAAMEARGLPAGSPSALRLFA